MLVTAMDDTAHRRSPNQMMALLAFTFIGCSSQSSPTSVEPQVQLVQAEVPRRIYHSPYQNVNWSSTKRIKAQHHDHTAARLDIIRAYDAAGYGALSLMDYSGAPALSYARKSVLWTPEQVGVSTTFQNTLTNLRIFIPNAEIVGESAHHMTSPFLTTYIEKYDALQSTVPADRQYNGPQDLIDKITHFGGTALLAHPWNTEDIYSNLTNFRGLEIYSAYAEYMKRTGNDEFVSDDHNARLLQLWDKRLATDQSIIGIAVNDHFGPGTTHVVDADIKDSGKIIVFARETTLPAYRTAFESGAFVAVRDPGSVKDRYPTINSIVSTVDALSIETDGNVEWIANGTIIAAGNTLRNDQLPPFATYVRAEISGANGTVVYTQAFSVRYQGDANGDDVVNEADTQICSAVRAGTEQNIDRVNACRIN